jgi:protein-tyrosine phosphatase
MRIGIMLALLAGGFAVLALVVVDSPWAAAPLGWSALALAYVALACLVGGPAWLGKRRDGRLRAPVVVLLLPHFLLSWGIWHLKRLLSSEPKSNEVAPELHVGRRPTGREELPDGTSLVVDLTSEFSEVAAVRALEGYRCIPALDGIAPAVSDAVRAQVREVAAHEGVVYVHCAVGHGRSAAFAGAVMVLRGQARDVQQAEQLMRRARPGIGLNAAQRRWVERITC